MSTTSLKTARVRIADCLQLDEQGRLVQRRDHLNLSGLDLTDAELTARFDPRERGLPEISLADLPYLRYLDLTGNQLTELPECVPGCTGLVWLGLNFNWLRKLPEQIGALVNLQRLYLRGNGLTELPASLGNLGALLELDLTGCEIARLPSALGRLGKWSVAVGEFLYHRSDRRLVGAGESPVGLQSQPVTADVVRRQMRIDREVDANVFGFLRGHHGLAVGGRSIGFDGLPH